MDNLSKQNIEVLAAQGKINELVELVVSLLNDEYEMGVDDGYADGYDAGYDAGYAVRDEAVD